MNSPSFEYYVCRLREFENATKWLKAWAGIYPKYFKYALLNDSNNIKYKKIKRKGEKARQRLFDLVD